MSMNNVVFSENTPQLITPVWNTPAPLIGHKVTSNVHELGSFDDDVFTPEFIFIESFDIHGHAAEDECLEKVLTGKTISQAEREALINTLKDYSKSFAGLTTKVPPPLMLDLALRETEVATEILVRLSTTLCFNEYLRALVSPEKVGIGYFTMIANLYCRVVLPNDYLPAFISGVLDIFESSRENTDFKMNSFMIFLSKFILRQGITLNEQLIKRIKCFCTLHSDLEWSDSVFKGLQYYNKV